jgi:hypothetical protein
MALSRHHRILGRAASAFLAMLAAPALAADMLPSLPPLALASSGEEIRDDPAWRERLVALFLDGTTRSERRTQRRLARWSNPIELTLHGAAEPYLDFVRALATDLQPLIGLPITVSTDSAVTGNMDVYIASSPAWWPPGIWQTDRRGMVFTCATAPSIRQGVIRRARIMINAGVLPPPTVRACLLEEIVQSLGLLGEVDDVAGTILNDQIGYEQLGTIDRLLLRALYDPRLVPDSDRATALPIATLVIGEALQAFACGRPEQPVCAAP